jgi:hypothetical protein
MRLALRNRLVIDGNVEIGCPKYADDDYGDDYEG